MSTEEQKEYLRQYRLRNAKVLKVKRDQYRKENAEAIKARKRRAYEEVKSDPEKLIALKKKNQDYYKNNYSSIHLTKMAKKYGLSSDEYKSLVKNGCEACGTKEGKLCVDHDHDTGEVRGCLCSNCNTALGYMRDSIKNIIGLYNYAVKKCKPKLELLK